MTKIVIIIPSRLNAKRLQNKPLKLINDKEMILHVHDVAVKANIGDVFVATPDIEILNIVRKNKGKAIITKTEHPTGTDRVFEVFEKELKSQPDFIINLQGDMPNLNPFVLQNLVNHMKKGKCDMSTLASSLKNEKEKKNPNVVKVITSNKINENEFSNALDFFRIPENTPHNNIYHHVGIYAFTNKALIRYVSLKRSKLELDRNLEQLRALENKMKIYVGFIESFPLSVDTELDLKKIKKIMEQ